MTSRGTGHFRRRYFVYFMHSYNGLVKMKKNNSLQVYEHSTMTRLGAVCGGMLFVAAA